MSDVPTDKELEESMEFVGGFVVPEVSEMISEAIGEGTISKNAMPYYDLWVLMTHILLGYGWTGEELAGDVRDHAAMVSLQMIMEDCAGSA